MTDDRYAIDVTPPAKRQLEKLSPATRRRLGLAIDRLALEPRPVGATILAGSRPVPIWRIRVGDYRVLYHLYDDRLLILVLRMGHRADVYRRRQVREDEAAYAVEQRAYSGLRTSESYVLADEQWQAFLKLLDRPGQPSEELAASLARKPPWNEAT